MVGGRAASSSVLYTLSLCLRTPTQYKGIAVGKGSSVCDGSNEGLNRPAPPRPASCFSRFPCRRPRSTPPLPASRPSFAAPSSEMLRRGLGEGRRATSSPAPSTHLCLLCSPNGSQGHTCLLITTWPEPGHGRHFRSPARVASVLKSDSLFSRLQGRLPRPGLGRRGRGRTPRGRAPLGEGGAPNLEKRELARKNQIQVVGVHPCLGDTKEGRAGRRRRGAPELATPAAPAPGPLPQRTTIRAAWAGFGHTQRPHLGRRPLSAQPRAPGSPPRSRPGGRVGPDPTNLSRDPPSQAPGPRWATSLSGCSLSDLCYGLNSRSLHPSAPTLPPNPRTESGGRP